MKNLLETFKTREMYYNIYYKHLKLYTFQAEHFCFYTVLTFSLCIKQTIQFVIISSALVPYAVESAGLPFQGQFPCKPRDLEIVAYFSIWTKYNATIQGLLML